MTKPISPHELKSKPIPDFVIEIVNKLIQENYSNGVASILQNKIEKEINKVKPIEYWWLDFEPLFEENGWEVDYDKPGFNEFYNASYTFTAKK